jgi:hypothetical protein
MNEMDTQTIETTRKLIALAQKQLRETGGDSSVFDPSTISREESAELASILAHKVWMKRSGVAKTTRRLAREMLKITAYKLEKGDRTGI